MTRFLHVVVAAPVKAVTVSVIGGAVVMALVEMVRIWVTGGDNETETE